MLAVRQRCRRVMEIYREAREQKGQVLVKLSDSSSFLGQDQGCQQLPLASQEHVSPRLETRLELG